MTTTARVKLTVDIKASSNWGDDTTITQIRKQAIEDVNFVLQSIERQHDVKIIGEPRVTTTTTENI